MKSGAQRRWFDRRSAVLAGALAALLPVMTARADDASLEYAVKATYLYKFAPFVTWPPSTAQKATFDLCLSGSDDVTKVAPEAAEGQAVNGKPLTIRRLAAGESADGCQILYIAPSPTAGLLLDTVRNKPVLTITEAAATNHGIVGFTVIQHHVRFDIDNALAQNAGLSISSKLLSLANAVTPVPGDTR
jgi:YfiR/HmsC-like